ncbi:MAG: indolepyruvate ferredoxin oxidoreductase subunit alpha, partial [Nitrospirae bacterium]
GELDQYKIKKAITGKEKKLFESIELPPRPPAMCPGCPHRGIFYSLSRLKVFVSGDIGCYTLGALKPLSAMDTCVCMGASIGNAHGIEKALGKEAQGRVVAVIGDSTFLHSGITGIINVVYNRGTSTVIILDNRTTAMTGHQENPATGKTAMGEDTVEIDLERLCKAIGIERVRVVNPHRIDETERIIKEELSVEAPSVIISKAPCALLPEERRRKKPLYFVDSEACTGCRSCLRLACPAISWKGISEEEAKRRGRPKQRGISVISEVLCTGCGECEIVCKFDAIKEVK